MPSPQACATPAEAGVVAAPAARRGLWIAVGVSVALFFVTCGLLLYAFMLNVDLGDLKRRLSKEIETRQLAERYLVETRNQLNESLRALEDLRAQLAYRDAEFQPVTAAPPALPVLMSFRSSILGRGLVAVLENTSDRELVVTLAVRSPQQGGARRFTVEIAPHGTTEFGHLEGWPFASGDEVALSQDGYAALRVTVP